MCPWAPVLQALGNYWPWARNLYDSRSEFSLHYSLWLHLPVFLDFSMVKQGQGGPLSNNRLCHYISLAQQRETSTNILRWFLSSCGNQRLSPDSYSKKSCDIATGGPRKSLNHPKINCVGLQFNCKQWRLHSQRIWDLNWIGMIISISFIFLQFSGNSITFFQIFLLR